MSAHQMESNSEGQRLALTPPPNDMESNVNSYKHRHPDVTPQEIVARYPPIAVPRKKSRRQIEATERCEGDTTEDYEKCLQKAEQKQPQRAAVKYMFFLSQSCHITDFEVGALGIHPQAPIITWDYVELNDIIMDHLVHHWGIKLEGFHMPEVVDGTYSLVEWLKCMSLIQDSDIVHQKEHPLLPYKKMFHSEFIDGLADPTQNEKILNIPMTHRGAPPPFG
ncbi:hypothetical protein F5146DRAFT_1001330 [Armillaria mellea]|nr:hypothetical protein F5146DRAFT_1001330 [Armillaria mellea]